MKRIRKFYILNIKMEGFKRFKEPFSVALDKVTYISGANGQGKTSVADAIAFAFCGTPFNGERSCDRLLHPECKEMNVEVRFVDENGELHILSRRRDLKSSTIMFDEIITRQSDISAMFADKDIFLSVLNPLYFIEKIADDGREFLQKLLPPVKESEILEMLDESSRTLIENENIPDPEFYIKKRREELKELDESDKYLDGQIDLLKTQRRETEEKLDSVLERGSKIVDRKTELEEKQFDGIDVEALKAKRTAMADNTQARAELIAKKTEVENRQYKSKYTDEIAKLRAEYTSLTGNYNSLLEKGKSVKTGDKCPTCNTVVTEENYTGIIAQIKKELAVIGSKATAVKAAYKEVMELDEKSRAKFEEFRDEDLKKIETELSSINSTESTEMLEAKIRLGNLSEDEFSELQALIKQADDYAREVNAMCETDKFPDKIKELEEAVEYNEKRRKELQLIIGAVKEYAAKRAEKTLENLKMERAAIKLFDTVKTTGEIKSAFRFTYDGKDYRWLSTSEKVRAGIEVSKLLARLTGLVYPVYIDNAECITSKFGSVYGQAIFAFARNTAFSVQYPVKIAEQMKEAA